MRLATSKLTWVLPGLAGLALCSAPVVQSTLLDDGRDTIVTSSVDATKGEQAGPRQTTLDIAALPPGTFVDEVAAASVMIAHVGDVEVHSPIKDSPLIGYHQASSAEALDMTVLLEPDGLPVGRAMVMPSRGRGNGPTTALDVVGAEDQQVLSPIDGVVVNVETYRLYGRYADVRIDIRSSVDPDVLVTMLHVTDPTVQVGDAVEAGRTPVAAHARKFRFASQVDKFVGYAAAHVHVEAKRG